MKTNRRLVLATPPDLIDPIMDEWHGRKVHARAELIWNVRAVGEAVRRSVIAKAKLAK